MLKKYKNEIFNILRNSEQGLDNFDFEETQIEQLDTIILTYKKAPFKFVIRNEPDDFERFDCNYTQFGPGYKMTGYLPFQNFEDFSYIVKKLKEWLNYHIKNYHEEEEAPDLWQEFLKRNKTINIDELNFDNQDNFTIQEKAQVTIAINELKLLIQKSINTSEAEQEIVVKRLDYLIRATDRLNKFDWKSLAVSTLISISITLTLDTEKGNLLFHLFKKVFSSLPQLINGQ